MRTHVESEAVQHMPSDRSLSERLRRKAFAFLYQLRTGYWFTGERVHPADLNNNYINHLRVYQYVSQFVANKDVLDVGCGVGYGTALLSRTARHCTGIDISRLAIREAYRLNPEGVYRLMDAEELAFPDGTFDITISTENFEHLLHQGKHLMELARVIRKDGFCFIATPNPELSVGANNKWHSKENNYDELMELLSARFRHIEIIEPMLLPTSPRGITAREERFARGAHGTLVDADLKVFGGEVNQTYLSNSHSFHCFVRDPIL